jgi:ribosomal protein S18 acetylase RimI-like enzyme
MKKDFKPHWIFDDISIDWNELSNLYKIAPLGNKNPDDLKMAFSNSMYKCFVYDGDKLIGVGRAIADGVDVSYLCDVAVHPEYQRCGIGKQIVRKLLEFSEGYNKILLFASVGKEPFYSKLGFDKMTTAMAIFKNRVRVLEMGLIHE